MADPRTLLLSIRPEHAARIFSGEKTVELRRIRPRVESGDTVLVYVTAPEMSLAGGFEVSRVYESPALRLWREVGSESGLDRSAFIEYFDGSESAYAIGVRSVWRLPHAVTLEKLRERVPGFLPPQSYWYLSRQLCETLLKSPTRLNAIFCR
jgi:predicted transcriptional regulator